MNTNLTEVDPLCEYNYGYAPYDYVHPNNSYSYNVKLEPIYHPLGMPTVPNAPTNLPPQHDNNSTIQNTEETTENIQESTGNNDSKEDIKPIISGGRIKKGKGKTSSYWNKKIADTNFPFYGCTICDVSFLSIPELDQHVTIHKGRLTSYDLRLKNQLKKKLIKREQRKLKKLGKKVKTENETLDIEIKPEDGYIGNEKAVDFNNTTDNNSQNNENIPRDNENTITQVKNPESNGPQKVDLSSKSKEIMNQYKEILEPEDPRLHKLFKCFACQKQFSLSYYLKLHVRSHTDEKPYVCEECGQSFITASKLGRHNKRIHLAIRFQCRICYRFFSRFDYLTRHFDKKHLDDKLEGEPYDYNAILPYLKELEEQLREKAEAKEEKPKPEDLFPEALPVADCKVEDSKDNKESIEIEQPVSVVINETVTYDADVEIKIEKEEPESTADASLKDEFDYDNDSVKNDSLSDDEYFPINTWATTPKVEIGADPAPNKKYKKSEFPRKCDQCDKIIKSASYMKVHLRTHTGERPFKCYICSRGFITSSKMHRHVLTHEEQDDENNVKQEDEIKTEQQPEDGVQKKRKRKSNLDKKQVKSVKRRKKEYQKRPFSCPFCNKRFLHKETMDVHIKCHDGEVMVLKCNFCLEEMPDEAALSLHESTHTGPKPFLCNLCGKSYTKRETMVYHRKTHNPDNAIDKKEFICDICSKTFNAQCKLQRHLVGHKVDKFILRYECPVCAHMFNTKYHIQMHLTTHQKEGLILEENRNEILAMVLQNARKIPKKPDAPITSDDLLPADERSRVCNICGQVFQHFYYLEEHLKSHGSKIAVEDDAKIEEKKHICKICNKGFKLHYYLKLHNFTHSKEKPFICQQCGKGFITKGKLKRHLETHTGLKKYQCHICYKFFTRPSYLRIHVRTIHGTQDYNFRLDKEYMPIMHNV